MTLVIAYQVIACQQGAAVPISKYITRYVFMDLIELKKRRKEKLKYELKSDRHPLSQMQVKVGLFSRSILHIYRKKHGVISADIHWINVEYYLRA